MSYQNMARIAKICRTLGDDEHKSYGPKYSMITEKGLMIYVDDYGHYMTVQASANGGRVLASTHPNECFCADGNWQDHILALEPQADKIIAEREKAEQQRKKDAIAAKLAPFNV